MRSFLFLFILFALNARAQNCAPADSNIIAWWDGDTLSGTTAFDIIDTNDGILKNGATITTGIVGDAYDFDGNDDFLETPLKIDFYSSGITISAWVKTKDAIGAIVSDGGGSTANRGIGLFIRNGGAVDVVGSYNNSGTRNFLAQGSKINNDTFHLVTATWTGDTTLYGVKIYVDGTVEDSATALSGISDGTYPIHWGGHGSISFNKLEGQIDEAMIYERVLTASEIMDIYLADSAGICKNKIVTNINGTKAYRHQNAENLMVYPNPSSGIINLSTTVDYAQLFDLKGQLIQEFFNVNSIDLTTYNSGLYLARFKIKDRTIRKRIVIQ